MEPGTIKRCLIVDCKEPAICEIRVADEWWAVCEHHTKGDHPKRPLASPPRVLGVKVEEMGQEYGNPSWKIAAVCSDGVTRVQTRYLSHTKPGIEQAQDSLDRWPALWRPWDRIDQYEGTPQLEELRGLLRDGA